MGHSEYDPGAKDLRPWNAGRKIGAKRALKPQQVWAIRFWLDRERRLGNRGTLRELWGTMAINHAFREMALALPLATEQDHFGAPSFRVKGKIFAQLSADGAAGLVKLSPRTQEWALSTYPDQCWSEPNWGRHGWTRLTWMSLPSEVVRDWLADSWRAVAPRSLHGLLVEPG